MSFALLKLMCLSAAKARHSKGHRCTFPSRSRPLVHAFAVDEHFVRENDELVHCGDDAVRQGWVDLQKLDGAEEERVPVDVNSAKRRHVEVSPSTYLPHKYLGFVVLTSGPSQPTMEV